MREILRQTFVDAAFVSVLRAARRKVMGSERMPRVDQELRSNILWFANWLVREGAGEVRVYQSRRDVDRPSWELRWRPQDVDPSSAERSGIFLLRMEDDRFVRHTIDGAKSWKPVEEVYESGRTRSTLSRLQVAIERAVPIPDDRGRKGVIYPLEKRIFNRFSDLAGQ